MTNLVTALILVRLMARPFDLLNLSTELLRVVVAVFPSKMLTISPEVAGRFHQKKNRSQLNTTCAHRKNNRFVRP